MCCRESAERVSIGQETISAKEFSIAMFLAGRSLKRKFRPFRLFSSMLQLPSMIWYSFKPLRVGHEVTASAPTPLRQEGLAHQLHFAKRWQERNDLSPNLLKQPKGLARSESRPCRKADRKGRVDTWRGIPDRLVNKTYGEYLLEYLLFAGIKPFLCRGLVQ
ncbi:hypothetical protein HAX54_024757 [Datura stramonium]|uniref:Uncharacterized protein n=1 Tax=Datura stramonium TaxID=4076 RepID=A0ABS8S5I8_DATST|nr:hypothetical protein [Datura stramonium]